MTIGKQWRAGIIRFVNMKLESDKIELDENFIIRKPLEEEQEEARQLHSLGSSLNLAIMETKIISENPREIQEVINKVELIFLLFKTAGTHCGSYELIQDSQPKPHKGNYIPYSTLLLSDVYLIKKDEEERLKKFWHELYQKLPKNFYSIEKSENYYSNAYWRYYDSLMYSLAVERKITDVIMGLEALYLNEELGELKYRVKMRLGKILALFNFDYNPLEIANEINDAYEIRNRYAHGATTTKIKAKIALKYDGGCATLFIKVLDYLRNSIILMFFCGKTKKELIKLIDNSLISPESEKELNEILKKCKILSLK
jgi:hypothetical protein